MLILAGSTQMPVWHLSQLVSESQNQPFPPFPQPCIPVSAGGAKQSEGSLPLTPLDGSLFFLNTIIIRNVLLYILY